jgi:hypothetical protein
MVKAQIPGTEPVFEGLAREVTDDPCIAFHLSQIRQGVTSAPW